MKQLRRILRAVFFPPASTGIALGILFLLLIAATFLFGLEDTTFAYAAYLLSAYGLYLLVQCALVPLVRKVLRQLRRIPAVDRYFSDKVFAARVNLYRGFLINIAFVLFKLISGIIYRSYWFIAVAFYYLVLVFVKAGVVRSDLRGRRSGATTQRDEWKIYRRTGWLLLLLNFALSILVFHVVRRGETYTYPGFLIFAIAAFAFYRISMAAAKVLARRKTESPLFRASRTVDFTVAVVAMFTLQTAMLSAFGGEDARATAVFNTVGGITAVVIVLTTAAVMILTTQKQLRN